MTTVVWGGEEPRSAPRLIGATFGMYRRYTLLFFVLAAAVVVPYMLIFLAVSGSGDREYDVGLDLLLTGINTGLVTPLISALHVHAVDAVRRGEEPRLGAVARQGVAVLPVVVVASVVATLGILAGFLLFVAPGVILSIRWFVVAQAAAIERRGWRSALSRSAELTEAHYWHVFGLILFIVVVTVSFWYLPEALFSDETTVPTVLVVTALMTFTYSFAALVSALAYFDLRARAVGQPV